MQANEGEAARRPKKRLFAKTWRGLVDVEVVHRHGTTTIIVSDVDERRRKADTIEDIRS